MLDWSRFQKADKSDAKSEEALFREKIRWSVALHIGIFAFFGLRAIFAPNQPVNLEAAIRVDMVGLPDKFTDLQKLPPPTKEKTAATKPQELPKPAAPVVLHPKKSAKAEKKDMAKALEKIQKEVTDEEAKEKQARLQKLQQILKGNKINPGTALTGLNKAEFGDYLSQIQSHVHEHWMLPEWLQNQNLHATVVVHIDNRGVIIGRAIETSSGDARFDDYALKAVDESSPFPPPPTKFEDLVKADGVVLRFPE